MVAEIRWRVAVLVLQALAVQGGPPGGAAEQEAAGPGVPGRPGEVADPLEPEHRVVDVERDHRAVRHRVRGGGGDPGRHGAGLVDALLQHLPGAGLLVEHQLLGVLGLVQLPDLGEDPELPEQALHAEGARLVGHDRHHPLADLLVPQQGGQDPDEGHRGGDLAVPGRLELGGERRQLGHRQRLRLGPPLRQRPAQGGPALVQVFLLRAAFGQLEERHLGDLVVGQVDGEPVAELPQHVLAHLLLLVGDVLALAGLTHAVALDRLGQDHRRRADVVHRGLVGGVDLLRVVPAAGQRPDLVVGHVRDQVQQLRVLAEEVLAHVGAVLGLEVLVLAVDAFLHALAAAARTCPRRSACPSHRPRSP